MKKHNKMRVLAVLTAALTLGSIPAFRPVKQSAVLLTATAAEADYPWSTYLKKSADWFGTQEALTVADACVQYQVAGEGGWEKGMGTAHTGDWAHSTIDNDATTSQIRFLMRSYAATGNRTYYDCAMRGVACLYKMQYSNGGWMQCLNTPNTYHAHITLNDGAYVHVLQIMQELSKKSGDFTAVSDSDAAAAAASLEKGIQCLLNMQIKVNGRKTAWCQQHNENTLAPDSARAYELPSICTSESAGVITFLYQYAKEHPERTDIVEAVNAAIEWFKKVQLNGIEFVKVGDDKVVRQNPDAAPLWARFYTLDTEVPLFSDRDGSTHYDVSEISQERRTGYSWYGNWGKNVVNLAPLDGKPAADPTYNGTLISSLTVHDRSNAEKWSIQQGLRVGSKVFGDRDFTVVYLPDYLTGAEYVQSACDSKTYTGDLADMTVSAPATAYVMVDMRLLEEQGLYPDWLGDWTQENGIVSISNTVEFWIFRKELNAGDSVKLGSNLTGQNVVNYFTAVVPKTVETTTAVTTTETTTTTTETTTTTTITTTTDIPHQRLSGDVDCSGSVDVSDAVLLARYLAEDAEAVITNAGMQNAECDGQPNLTGNDIVTILKYVAMLIDKFPV